MVNTVNNTISVSEAFKNFNTVRTDLYSESNNVSQSAFPPVTLPVQINDSVKINTLKPIIPADKEPDDYEVSNNPLNKMAVTTKKYAKIPDYMHRGLKGDTNSNFYELMTLSKFPYFVGGPMLALMFLMGASKKNIDSRISATKMFKKIGVGVAFYYIGVELARFAIAAPARIFRGIDLSHPFVHKNKCKTDSADGHTPSRTEYHEVPESIDFTRWNFIYGVKEENGKAVNLKTDRLSRKFGIDKNVQDSDSTLKENITKLLVSAKACQYMLAAPFVALGVGLAAQEPWGEIGKSIGKEFNSMLNPKSGLNTRERLRKAVDVARENLTTPLKKSFKLLWNTKAGVGKIIIGISILAPIVANIRILQLTSLKHNRFIDTSDYFRRKTHGQQTPIK